MKKTRQKGMGEKLIVYQLPYKNYAQGVLYFQCDIMQFHEIASLAIGCIVNKIATITHIEFATIEPTSGRKNMARIRVNAQKGISISELTLHLDQVQNFIESQLKKSNNENT